MEKAEEACTLLCKVALTLNKFTTTKEGRTAMLWVSWMAATKIAQLTSMVVVPSLGTAAFSIAFICSAAYGFETIIGDLPNDQPCHSSSDDFEDKARK